MLGLSMMLLIEGLKDGYMSTCLVPPVNITFFPIIQVQLAKAFTLIVVFSGHRRAVLHSSVPLEAIGTPLLQVKLQLSPLKQMVLPLSLLSGQCTLKVVQDAPMDMLIPMWSRRKAANKQIFAYILIIIYWQLVSSARYILHYKLRQYFFNMSNSAATNIEVENQIGRLKPKFNPLVVVALLAVFVGVGCAFCQQAKINNLQHERIMQQSILPAGGGTGPTLAPGGPRPAVSPSPGGPGPTVRPGGPNMASPPPRPQPRAQPEIPGTYDDDEPFLESDTPQGGKEGKVEARLLAQRSQVKLGEKTVLPAMYQVNSSGGDRTSVDLICVIDVSGSMTGQKIELVKSTMKYIVETLTPSDRLSIVTFQSSAKRITPLMAGTKENQVILNKHIDQIRAGGGTIIPNGMNVAFKVMRDRKLQNKATSIFLLSDGLDNEGNAQFRVKDALGQSKNKKLGVFSIHSFGFGSDHDEQMMNDIALLRDGSFYFIKELNTLDEAFSNALGGIISLAVSQVILNVHCISEGLLEGAKITKVYGDKWEKISEKQYKIRITQLISDVSKQFVFQLTIPAIQGEVAAEERSQVVVEGMMQAKVINGPQVDQPSSLSITLIDSNDQMVDDENVEVIESYLRVRAAEAIEKSIKLAEDNMFSEAQRLLADMINMIRNNKKARKDKMQVLLKDLQRIKQKLSAQDWEREGRKYALNAQGSHNNQGGFAYANTVQSSMVAQRAALKTQP